MQIPERKEIFQNLIHKFLNTFFYSSAKSHVSLLR